MKFLFSFFLATVLSFGQSEFMDSTSLGLGVGFSYSQNDISSVNGYDIVTTMHGLVDVGFQFAKANIDGENLHYNIESSSSLLYLAYNIKKRNNTFNLKVMLGYYNGKAEDEYARQSFLSGAVAGLGLYPRLVLEKILVIRAALEFTYVFISDPAESISLGLSARLIISPIFNLVLSPFISKDINNREVSLFYGLNGRVLFCFTSAE